MSPHTVEGVELELTPTDRIRSPGDVLRLLSGLLVLAVGVVLAVWARRTIGGAEADLARGLSRLPSRWERVLLGLVEAIVATAVVAIAGFLVFTHRVRRLGWLLLTVVVSSGLTFLLGWGLTTRRIEVLPGVDTTDAWFLADRAFPSSGLIASVTAGVVFGSPWLTQRWRQTGWTAVGVLVLLRVGVAADPSVDVVAAIGIGIVVGSAVLLLRGAPSLEPAPQELVRSLRAAGLHPSRVTQLAPGHTTVTYRVHQVHGPTVRLGLRTPHDRSADLLTHMWQTVRLRADEVDEPFNTIQHRVEHEALALTMATRSGARVPAFEALVGTVDDSMGIAETEIGGGTAADHPERLRPLVLGEAWRQVECLHHAGIAHRALSLRHVRIDDEGRPWITGFHRARLVADKRERAKDVAQLLTDSAATVGPNAAVDAAVGALGADATAAALPLLQPLALPRSTRRSLRAHPDLLGDLRDRVAQRTGVAEAPLERIERVRPRTVVTVLALTLAFYLVLPQLADLQSTATAFAKADWAWAPWIIVGSALTYGFAAVSFVGAVPEPVPFLPALRAQVASSFVTLIAPANSGSLALGVRFLQRSGVDAAPAAASVGLNTAAGFVVHLALTAVFVVWNGSSGVGSFSLPDASLVLGAVAIVLALVGLSMLFRGVRDRVLGPMTRALRAAASSVGAVLTSPVRVAQLVGGSIGISLAYILAIAAAVEAFGGGPTFTQIAVGYLVASALASVSPTPGGLGAFEAAMITALTGFGMGGGAAVSATLAFRLATYWLPVLPGWFSFNWMQRHQEV